MQLVFLLTQILHAYQSALATAASDQIVDDLCLMLIHFRDLIQRGYPGKIAKHYTKTYFRVINLTFQLCMWSQKPPETVSNVKNFLGKHAPGHPSLGTLQHTYFRPSAKKILY